MSTSNEYLQMLAQLLSQSGYAARSRQELEEEAALSTQSAYDQKRLSAQNEYDTQMLALARELAELKDSYSTERERSTADYSQGYGQLSREHQRRGMQRSSYASQSLENLLMAAAQAQQSISARETDAVSQLREREELAARQLASQLSSYDTQQEQDTRSALLKLLSQESERESTARQNQLSQLQQLYQYQYRQEQDEREQQNWLQEYNAKYGEAAASSSSRGGGQKRSTTKRTVRRHTI